MKTSTNTIRIVQAAGAQADEVAEVLTDAFLGYPMMQYLFPPGTTELRMRLRAMFGLTGWYRLQTGHPLLAAELDGRIVGAAGLVAPDPLPDPSDMEIVAEDAFRIIGHHAAEKLEAYSKLKDAHKPESGHYYLAMIGILPEVQGRGIGQAMMQRIGEISRDNPASEGVALDTQSESNVAFYKRQGYQVRATEKLGAVDMWFMFRADGA